MNRATVELAEHPVLACDECHRDFDAALPLTRRGLARSRLMFLVEQCPACRQTRTYLRNEYRFVPTARLLSA